MKKCIMNVGIASDWWSFAPREEVLLDDDLAEKWQECAHCTIIEDLPEQEVSNVPQEIADSIESLGGGWYMVHDGNKFKGRSAAEEYLMGIGGGAANADNDARNDAPEQADPAGGGTPVSGDSEAAPQN